VLLASASSWFEAIVERWSDQHRQQHADPAPPIKKRTRRSAANVSSTQVASQQQQQQRQCVYMDVDSVEEAGHLEAVLKQVGAAAPSTPAACGRPQHTCSRMMPHALHACVLRGRLGTLMPLKP
jgi:hypothetical protein